MRLHMRISTWKKNKQTEIIEKDAVGTLKHAYIYLRSFLCDFILLLVMMKLQWRYTLKFPLHMNTARISVHVYLSHEKLKKKKKELYIT